MTVLNVSLERHTKMSSSSDWVDDTHTGPSYPA